MMKRWIIGVTGLAALGAVAAAQAQDRGPGGPFHGGPEERGAGRWGVLSPADREAFTDARIAALHAGVKLTADQEKLWPPVEEAIRNLAKVRRDSQQSGRERFAAFRETGERDLIGGIRFIAERQASMSQALTKLADAATPLYGSLDDAQKRRLGILSRGLGPRMGMGMQGGPGREGPGREGPGPR
ncbi:MAG: Spy/CpxP family protein refolding chaperone [Methylobacteriaceae bacterium]|nr:Spy/CpxP family protein refolding chaperone [Methylobacteriaceae bacterium]